MVGVVGQSLHVPLGVSVMNRIVTVVGIMLAFGVAFVIGVGATQIGRPKTDEELKEWIQKEVASSKAILPQDCGNGQT